MNRHEREHLERRYLQDEAISPARQIDYLAAKHMDGMLALTTGLATLIFGGITLTSYLGNRVERLAIKFDIASAPSRMENMGERHSALRSADDRISHGERYDLENAVRKVLSRGPDDIRNLTLIFSESGNQVTLVETGTRASFQRAVDPEALASAYKEKRQETLDALNQSTNVILQLGGMLTGGMAFFTLWMLRLRQERIQRVLDHYQVK